MREQHVYVGNCSKNGIYHYKFKNGKLVKKNATNDFERCTYLCINKTNLYSVIETQEQKKHGYVLSYQRCNEDLINIDKITSYGQGPCHIEINDKKRLLFVSNYIDGYLTIFKINKDGKIGNKIYSNVEKKGKSHLHCVKTSMDYRCFFIADLGADVIVAYEIKDNGIREISRLQLKNGTQPRHIVVGKDKIFVVSEKTCELYIIGFKEKKLSIIDIVPILPKSIKLKENYTGCAVKISKNLRYLYVSIRGHNSISIYKINKNSVILIQNTSCKGNTPRDLELDKTGKYILVANQDSNEIVIFKRNRLTGKIKYKEKEEMNLPTCVLLE